MEHVNKYILKNTYIYTIRLHETRKCFRYFLLFYSDNVRLITYHIGISTPLQTLTGLSGSRSLRFLEFLDIRHVEVVRLSALHTGGLYPLRDIPGNNRAVGKIK